MKIIPIPPSIIEITWNGVILNLISLMRPPTLIGDQYPHPSEFRQYFPDFVAHSIFVFTFYSVSPLHTHSSRNRSGYEVFFFKIRIFVLPDS